MKKKKRKSLFRLYPTKVKRFLQTDETKTKKKKLKRKQKPGIGRKSRVSSIQTEDIFVNIIS